MMLARLLESWPLSLLYFQRFYFTTAFVHIVSGLLDFVAELPINTSACSCNDGAAAHELRIAQVWISIRGSSIYCICRFVFQAGHPAMLWHTAIGRLASFPLSPGVVFGARSIPLRRCIHGSLSSAGCVRAEHFAICGARKRQRIGMDWGPPGSCGVGGWLWVCRCVHSSVDIFT